MMVFFFKHYFLLLDGTSKEERECCDKNTSWFLENPAMGKTPPHLQNSYTPIVLSAFG